MIGRLLRVQWTELTRDRISQLLTFALPIAFFSIFAIIFGGQQGSAKTPKVKVIIVDDDKSEASKRLVRALESEAGLQVATRVGKEPTVPDRAKAAALVRGGDFPVALVIPSGWGASFPDFTGEGAKVELLADVSNPVGPQMVGGLLQKAAMTAAPDLLAKRGLEQFEQFAGIFTPEQRTNVQRWIAELNNVAAAGAADSTSTNSGAQAGFAGLVGIKTVDLLGEKKKNPVISFYAAGIGVMFLLFSCAGAGGSLLEEVENGTLERLLSTRLGMGQLLLGKWIYLTLMGIAQLVVMFVWGAVVFGVELMSHLAGFAVMTVVTAAAAAGLGMVLATACKTRAQLSGVSTFVILGMSAVGGSMVPRFIMTETMQKFGLLTFNGWALDGYLKVFWREEPLWRLLPQVLVLAASAVVFMVIARSLARRWEQV